MNTEYQTYRTRQELVDENKDFIEELRPEDIEYSQRAMKLLEHCAQDIPNKLLANLQDVDFDDFYYAKFPRDHSHICLDGNTFYWNIAYLSRKGRQIKTISEVLSLPKIDRIIQIEIPSDPDSY